MSLPPAAVEGIKEVLGLTTVGTCVALMVYGITILQTYIYFRRYKHDHVYFRILVGILFTLDTLASFFMAYGLYVMVVVRYDAPAENIVTPWSLNIENGLSVCMAPFSQCFFASRLWILSKKNKYLVAAIVTLSIGALAPGLAITANLFIHPDISFISGTETRILAGFANGLSTICDITIAIGLCHYLSTHRSGLKSRTDSVVDSLMIYAINRGLITATCQLCHMILADAAPGRFLYIPFALLQAKLYCNTVLATLNVRQSLQTGGMSRPVLELESHILSPMPGSACTYTTDGSTVLGQTSNANAVPITLDMADKTARDGVMITMSTYESTDAKGEYEA